MAKSYNDRAGDEAKEIAALNKSIFRPTFVWNKEKKRNAEEERIVRRHVAEQERREENRQMRAESAKNIQGNLREAEKPRSRWGGSAKAAEYGEASAQQSKMANRARYQFEADEEDDAIEDELDQNLDEIGDMSRRLNLLARAAGDEVRQQNNTLGNLNNKTDKCAGATRTRPRAVASCADSAAHLLCPTVSTSRSSAPLRDWLVSSESLFLFFCFLYLLLARPAFSHCRSLLDFLLESLLPLFLLTTTCLWLLLTGILLQYGASALVL